LLARQVRESRDDDRSRGRRLGTCGLVVRRPAIQPDAQQTRPCGPDRIGVQAVANVRCLAGLDAEDRARVQKDARMRLDLTEVARRDHMVEKPRDAQRVEFGLLEVGDAVRDDAESIVRQRLERGERILVELPGGAVLVKIVLEPLLRVGVGGERNAIRFEKVGCASPPLAEVVELAVEVSGVVLLLECAPACGLSRVVRSVLEQPNRAEVCDDAILDGPAVGEQRIVEIEQHYRDHVTILYGDCVHTDTGRELRGASHAADLRWSAPIRSG